MSIRRTMPVIVTDDPAGTRAFYESFLGFRVVMDEDGLLMLASPSVPTTQLIVCWASPTAMDPEVLAFVERLEEAAGQDTRPLGPGDLPSGDTIASEFQRFLRQQGPER